MQNKYENAHETARINSIYRNVNNKCGGVWTILQMNERISSLYAAPETSWPYSSALHSILEYISRYLYTRLVE